MQVELSEHSEELVRGAIEAGYAKDACDAVASGLLLLEQAQLQEQMPAWDEAYAAEVNAKIEEGLEAAAAGRLYEGTPEFFEDIKKRGRERMRARRRASV